MSNKKLYCVTVEVNIPVHAESETEAITIGSQVAKYEIEETIKPNYTVRLADKNLHYDNHWAIDAYPYRAGGSHITIGEIWDQQDENDPNSKLNQR
jgi:hypothetical protein